MKQTISREKVDNDLYTFLRTIYHYERNIAAKFGLDYQEIYCLQSLRRVSPQRLTEIANTLEVPMFTASRLVGRLVEEEYLTKVKGSHDRRSISISLLPKGEEVVKAIEEDSYNNILKQSENLNDEGFAALFAMAETLYKVLGVPEARVK
jgi:DNA-binding MarR family transcriptional regulator